MLKDAQTDPPQTEKNDVTTGGVYWDVAKNDSASTTNEVNQVTASSAPNSKSGETIVYSAVEIVNGQAQDNLT